MALFLKAAIVFMATIYGYFLGGNPPIDYVCSGILILGLGIPHGGSDHLLYNLSKTWVLSSRLSLPFLGQYLGTILVYLLVWLLLPSISLLIFVLVSAYHFGETQFQKFESRHWTFYLLAFLWGMLVLQSLLALHPEEVRNILSPILPLEILSTWGSVNPALSIGMAGATVMVQTLFFVRRKKYRELGVEMIEMGMLYWIFSTTSLLMGFAIFFAFWHSRDAIAIQISNIQKVVPEFNYRSFVKATFPFTLLSIVGIAAIILTLQFYAFNIPTVLVFFIIVSLLTMPHMFVIADFYRTFASPEVRSDELADHP